jgi:hypothetical protein
MACRYAIEFINSNLQIPSSTPGSPRMFKIGTSLQKLLQSTRLLRMKILRLRRRFRRYPLGLELLLVTSTRESLRHLFRARLGNIWRPISSAARVS